MAMTPPTRSGIRLALALLTAATVVWIAGGDESNATAAQTNFVGGAPSRPDSSDIRALRLRFEAGSRSNWHSHSNWQILMAEDGRGRTQVRGEAWQDLTPGNPVYAGPNVVHWHGAGPDSYVVQLTFVSGETTWEGPVSEEDYLGQ